VDPAERPTEHRNTKKFMGEVSLGARAINESLARGFRLPRSSERHMESCGWIRSPGKLTAKRGINEGSPGCAMAILGNSNHSSQDDISARAVSLGFVSIMWRRAH